MNFHILQLSYNNLKHDLKIIHTKMQRSKNCVECGRREDFIKAKNCQWYDRERNEII